MPPPILPMESDTLLGSVIKHHLVTHLSLGIALRYVLMHCASLQIQKCLCSELWHWSNGAICGLPYSVAPVLQSHFANFPFARRTHSKIVAFIGQALARISFGHTDVDGRSHASAVISKHSSAQATLGHVEVPWSPLEVASWNHLSTRDALDKYQIVAQKGVISEVPEIILRCVSRDEAALAVAQKIFKGLYDNASNSVHVYAYLAILTAIPDVCKLAVKELTSWAIYLDEEMKYNKDTTVGLIRSELLNLTEYNVRMAKLTDGGSNKATTEFSISHLQSLVIQEPKGVSELHNLIDALAMLIEMIKHPVALSASNAGKEDKARQSRNNKDPSLLVANREELNIVDSVKPDPAGIREQLHQSGLLKGDGMTYHFFHRLMETTVAHCVSTKGINSRELQSPQQMLTMSFLAIGI